MTAPLCTVVTGGEQPMRIVHRTYPSGSPQSKIFKRYGEHMVLVSNVGQHTQIKTGFVHHGWIITPTFDASPRPKSGSHMLVRYANERQALARVVSPQKIGLTILRLVEDTDETGIPLLASPIPRTGTRITVWGYTRESQELAISIGRVLDNSGRIQVASNSGIPVFPTDATWGDLMYGGPVFDEKNINSIGLAAWTVSLTEAPDLPPWREMSVVIPASEILGALATLGSGHQPRAAE